MMVGIIMTDQLLTKCNYSGTQIIDITCNFLIINLSKPLAMRVRLE